MRTTSGRGVHMGWRQYKASSTRLRSAHGLLNGAHAGVVRFRCASNLGQVFDILVDYANGGDDFLTGGQDVDSDVISVGRGIRGSWMREQYT